MMAWSYYVVSIFDSVILAPHNVTFFVVHVVQYYEDDTKHIQHFLFSPFLSKFGYHLVEVSHQLFGPSRKLIL